jgi:hypothetical protein
MLNKVYNLELKFWCDVIPCFKQLKSGTQGESHNLCKKPINLINLMERQAESLAIHVT